MGHHILYTYMYAWLITLLQWTYFELYVSFNNQKLCIEIGQYIEISQMLASKL